MPTHAKHRHAVPTRRPLLSAIARWRSRRRSLLAAGTVAAVVAVATGISLSAPASAVEYVKDATVARADFSARTAGGWGAASIGGNWVYDTPSAFRSDDATGSVALPAPGTSVTGALDGVGAADVEAGATVAVDALPRGGAAYSGVQVRKSGMTYYMAQLRTTPEGTATVSVLRVNGSTSTQVWVVKDVAAVRDIAPGSRIGLQIRATGSDPVVVQARAWKAGSPPPTWQATGADSSAERIARPGTVALWTYSSRVSDVTGFSWDDLLVDSLTTTVPSPTPPGTPPPSDTPAPAPTTPVPSPTSPTPDPTPPPAQTPTDPSPPADAGAPSDPAIDTSGVRNAVGAARIGSTRYDVPTGAVFASGSASAAGDGSAQAPFSRIQAAIDAAPSGSTVVVRGGTYHESLVLPAGKRLTVQSYPGEAVWLDGSSPVTGFVRDGSGWVSNGWTTRFDASPTYRRGAADGSGSFGFVNPSFPMAANPDQVWIDGVAQAQVGSAAQLAPGRFFVDYGSQKLYLGSDPAGRSVRASTLVKAITIAGSGSVVRGLGVLRYAPSVPDMGAVVATGRDVTIENVSITDNSTTGLSMESTGGRVTRVTTSRNGLIGSHANYADGLRVTGLLSTDNNTERFNRAPVSGGFKITRSRDVSVTRSAILRNQGHGLWFDESVYNATVTDNDLIGNQGTGLFQELSSVFTIADNVIAGNGQTGINIADSNQSQIWNNSISGSPRLINVIQGDRRAANLSTPGHDPRQKLPDPTVTWVMGDIAVRNNVLADSTGTCLLCVEDYSRQQSAEQARISAESNVYRRATAGSPAWVVVWSSGPGNPRTFGTVPSFTSTTGQERNGRGLDGIPVLGSFGQPLAAVMALVGSLAQPMPAAVAELIDQPAGIRRIGAFER